MNNVLDQVLMVIPDDEYNMLFEAITESAEHIVNYLSSFAGMIKTANTDFSNTQINLEEMMKTLDDPEKISGRAAGCFEGDEEGKTIELFKNKRNP